MTPPSATSDNSQGEGGGGGAPQICKTAGRRCGREAGKGGQKGRRGGHEAAGLQGREAGRWAQAAAWGQGGVGGGGAEAVSATGGARWTEERPSGSCLPKWPMWLGNRIPL